MMKHVVTSMTTGRDACAQIENRC
jgi:hypothetical protein